MSSVPTLTGQIPFTVPSAGVPCTTWYKVLGNLSSSNPPLITLHGGPGAGSSYFSNFLTLWTNYSIPVILYDQIGCGHSTHLRDKANDTSFWTIPLFLSELENLISYLELQKSGYYLYGQSWGGIVASSFAATNPPGLKKLILSSAPASVPTFSSETQRLIRTLPQDVQDTIADCERRGDTTSEAWQAATMEFYSRFVCRLPQPWPDELMEGFANLADDPTVYSTLQGPSEFLVTGSIANWTGIALAPSISAPTLVINGEYDEMTDACVQPWVDKIPDVRWEKFDNASHMSHLEEPERYFKVVGEFIGGAK
ncbi:Alpha/Beta hydrolase protein [Clohesyomyces aquaticus]|uniref:Alpha/Beta hydrolase protein n=1 Tax=Clohesyomyces aquaticus TaxID=1231657 RepID=A0A1Y1YVA3_9PLEO|nr:Alpha/Beta hydrolase protein [Clohesyomyces aquaticus]